MNSSVSSQSECFSLIVALKYVMAGDMESVALLSQLEGRYRSIKWSDPQYVEFTETMRGGRLEPSALGRDPVAKLLALLHYQVERNAADDEAMAALVPAVQKQGEQLTASLLLACQLGLLIGSMKQHLELLGPIPHTTA
jgi:hypothetical protein